MKVFINKIIWIININNPEKRRMAEIDYDAYGFEVHEPVLKKKNVLPLYRSGTHYYQLILTDTSKTGNEAIVTYYCTCETV